MRIIYFHVDSFVTSGVFSGNPAGVCLLEAWLPDAVLQEIATENNLSETAFLFRRDDGFEIRWFTPAAEVDLCGHATLAAAHVLWEHLAFKEPALAFESKSGVLTVRRLPDLIELDFPARAPEPCDTPAGLGKALGIAPKEVLKSRDYFLVYENEKQILDLVPNYEAIAKLDSLGVIVTAPGIGSDFVSRFFAPRVGIPEDPVTGSAHCSLIPYWANKLGKNQLTAVQLSPRRGRISCEARGERVGIAGRAVTYLEGVLTVPDPK